MAAPKRSIVMRAPEGEVGWTLIELQGSMEPRNGKTSLDGVEFGTLKYEEEGAPRLVMGKMQLEGHVVQLKKPLAIMTLRKPDESSTEYHVAGTVRQKLVFKTRQVPVPVAKAAPAAPSLCGTKRTRAAEGPQASPQGAQPAEATVS